MSSRCNLRTNRTNTLLALVLTRSSGLQNNLHLLAAGEGREPRVRVVVHARQQLRGQACHVRQEGEGVRQGCQLGRAVDVQQVASLLMAPSAWLAGWNLVNLLGPLESLFCGPRLVLCVESPNNMLKSSCLNSGMVWPTHAPRSSQHGRSQLNCISLKCHFSLLSSQSNLAWFPWDIGLLHLNAVAEAVQSKRAYRTPLQMRARARQRGPSKGTSEHLPCSSPEDWRCCSSTAACRPASSGGRGRRAAPGTRTAWGSRSRCRPARGTGWCRRWSSRRRLRTADGGCLQGSIGLTWRSTKSSSGKRPRHKFKTRATLKPKIVLKILPGKFFHTNDVLPQ